MLKARAYIFLLLGIIMLGFLLSVGKNMDIFQIIIFGFIIFLLFFGAIVVFIATLKADDRKRELDPSKPIFQCKHCGEKYNDEKMKDRHEKSCVKMRI